MTILFEMTTLLMAPASEDQNPLISLLPLILIILVFYLFMIRPQVKKQKELKNFRASLQKGDKVVTTGGIYGKIVQLAERYIEIEVGEGVKLRIDKNAVLKDPGDIQDKR